MRSSIHVLRQGACICGNPL